jgi:putative methyltransferase (TIGR04325 family)
MAILSIVYERRESFAQASAEAGQGYENSVLLKDAPTEPYDVSNAPIIDVPTFFGHAAAAFGVAALRLKRKTLRVLDVGGALGGHFGFARATFGDGLDFDWTVVETKTYVDHGRRLITSPGLSFVDNLEAVAGETFDLAYFSSVFPYVPDFEGILSASAVRNAPFVYVGRTNLNDEEINFLQTVTYDTGVLRYPGRVLARDAFMAQMRREHDLLTSWQFEQYGVENRAYPAPAMLWRKRDM